MANRMSRWASAHRALTALIVLGLVGLTGASFIAGRRPGGPASQPQERRETPAPTEPSIEEPSPSPSPSPSPTVAAEAPACRTDPLANVYHPDRLRVVRECATVTGVVRLVRHEADGDMHINVRLDPAFADLINATNIAQQNGDLVVEIVPADEPGCVLGRPPVAPSGTYDYGICTGSNVLTPRIGTRVRVTGPYVEDTKHGWMEIHPAWDIVALGVPPAPPAKSIRIVSISPDPLQPGRTATLVAQTTPGSLCVITIRYPSGRASQAKGLVQENADSRGRVSWTWNVGTTTKAGIGAAIVTCGGLTDQGSFTVA